MLNFIIMNLVVGFNAAMIVKYFFNFYDKVEYLTSVFIIFLSQIVVTLLLLGLLSKLYFRNVIILNILIFLSLCIAIKIYKLKPKEYVFSNELFNLDELLAHRLTRLCLSVLLGFTLIKLVVNLVNPPFGWDSIGYHFSFPVEWFKHGNLINPITIFDDPSPTYYPINGSLFYLWLIFPFKSVFLADLGQFPFFIIAAFSVYSIAQKVGLNRTNSLYSVVLFALIPNFFKQLQIAYVDVMVGALFLVCVNYLFVLKKDFNWQNVLIYSLSLGLLIGTKITVLPFSVLLIIPFLLLCFKNYRKVNLSLIFIFCILIFGCFSYFRNWFETRNPLYPLDFSLLNINIFKGVMDKAVYTGEFSAWNYSLGKMLFHEGLGAQALLLILPGICLTLPLVFVRKRSDLDLGFTYFLLLPLFIYSLYRYIIPIPNVRYLYAMMGIGVVLGFYLLDLLKVKRMAINMLVILCLLSSIPSLAKRQELAAALILTVVFFLLLTNFIRAKILSNKKLILSLVCVLISSLFFLGENYYKKNEFSRYYKMVKYSGFWPDATKAWDWLNNETVGNNIAYVGKAVPFPLYGSNLKNNVYYVSVNRTQPAKLHYFNNSKYEYGRGYESLLKSIEERNNYRGNADYNIWLDNLFKVKTDYLFVYSLRQTKSTIFPLEDNWAMVNTDKFKLVFVNNTVHIYKVIK